MISSADRDRLFKAFGRAFFRQDLDAMYETVTPDFTWRIAVDGQPRSLASRAAIEGFFTERNAAYEGIRFEDVEFHHAPDATFMTFRMTARERASGRTVASVGVERYTFRDGRIALKDVYSRPAAD